jgi:L-lactate dehydrogenase complex protein LldG
MAEIGRPVAAREEILAALRRGARAAEPPDLSALGAKFPDPVAQLVKAVEAVAGACVRVADRAAADRALAELAVVRDAKKVISLVPGVGRSDVDLAAIDDPHALEGLDVAVLPGVLAVAENGAIWVDGAALRHRAVFVICEHLVLVVEAGAVVNDLHEAYARIGAEAVGYGLFIAGPSKTADIEQALVIGAHGARSCTVLVVGEASSRRTAPGA